MTKRALVIEDTALHRKLYAIWLELSGYVASTTSDERFALVDALRDQPDLIMVDILLPSIDGRDVIRSLRYNAQTQHIPIIAFSVISSVEDEESCYAAGATAFHKKLSGRADFLACIERIG